MSPTSLYSPEFSFYSRPRLKAQCENQIFDVAVIGGGITGAAVARDAALRGLKVILLEADDFASGTSSGSTKLLHGGLRYLQQFDFKLVAEAIQEREKLLKLYAPLANDLSFVFPTFKGVPPSRWKLNLGLLLYDAFSFFRRRHQNLSRSITLQQFPFLKDEKLTGSCIYSDSFAEDYRLVTEVIKSAHRLNTICLSKMKVVEIATAKDGVIEIQVEDVWDPEKQTLAALRARFVFNCAGPFSDSVRRLLDLPPVLKLTQGVHILIRKEKLNIDHAFVFSDPKLDRILFAIPWNSVVYLGTTDTSISDPSKAQIHSEDLEYILSIFSNYLHTPIDRSDVIQSWAAVRPLLAPESGKPNSQISREFKIEENPKNIFHILGGKLTSHRLMAEEAVDLLAPNIDALPKSKTHEVPLQDISWEPHLTRSRLARVYGRFSADVLALDEQRNLNSSKITPEVPHLAAEVFYSIRHEMALTPLDFIRRRSSLYYEFPSNKVAAAVTQLFAKEMGWSKEKEDLHYEEILKSYSRDRDF